MNDKITIETERLFLVPWTMDMAGELYDYARNPDVGPHAGWKPHQDVEESQEIIRDLFIPNGVFAIALKETGRIVGSVGFEKDKRRPDFPSMELGYSLGRDYWGSGIMTEAARAVIDYGFETMGLEVIAICTSRANARSQGVIKNCGFTYEGTERKVYKIYTGEQRDSMCFSLLKEEWEVLKQTQ